MLALTSVPTLTGPFTTPYRYLTGPGHAFRSMFMRVLTDLTGPRGSKGGTPGTPGYPPGCPHLLSRPGVKVAERPFQIPKVCCTVLHPKIFSRTLQPVPWEACALAIGCCAVLCPSVVQKRTPGQFRTKRRWMQHFLLIIRNLRRIRSNSPVLPVDHEAILKFRDARASLVL